MTHKDGTAGCQAWCNAYVCAARCPHCGRAEALASIEQGFQWLGALKTVSCPAAEAIRAKLKQLHREVSALTWTKGGAR